MLPRLLPAAPRVAESAHAVAHALITAREMGTGTVLVNLSGRGDKDMDYVIENWVIGRSAGPGQRGRQL